MSETLVWQLLRTNSSFLVKRGQTKRDGGVQFSREPGNILNLNSFKYSGLANNNTVNLTASADGINVALKSSKLVNKPVKAYSSATVSSLKELTAATAGYRKDLSAAARIRFSKLNCSIKRKAAGAAGKKANSRDGRKAKRAGM